MVWLALIFACLAGLMWFRVIRMRRFVRDLFEAVDARRPYLLDQSSALTKRAGLERLAMAYNDILAEQERSSQQEQGYLRQIDTTLSNLTEAVLIINGRNQIIMANQAACSLLGILRPLQGIRLESVLHSAGFLEYMTLAENGDAPAWQEIKIDRGNETLFVEVTGAQIPDSGKGPDALMLFVLHDISRLKRLETVRREFVANVSHELRTPVTVIKGFTDALIEDFDQLPREEAGRFLRKIASNVHRLNLLLEDLLTLSRLENAGARVQREPASLQELIHSVVEDARTQLEESDRGIVLDLDPSLDRLMLDPIKISQVVRNVIDNAIRYARGFSNIEIRTSRQDQSFSLAISDDGCGIPEPDLPHIFERFYRVDKGRSRELGGTGLGLSIVKHIVQLHGGEVKAWNCPSGGLCIEAVLPIVEDPAYAARTAEAAKS